MDIIYKFCMKNNYFGDAEEDLDYMAPYCGPDLDDFTDDKARVYHANGMVVHQFDELVF